MQLGKKGKKGRIRYYHFSFSSAVFSVFIAVQATEMPEEGANIKNIRITGSVSLDDGNSPAGIQAELYETPFYTDTVRYSGTSASPVGSVSVSDDGTYAFEEVPKGEYSLVFSGGNGVNLQEYSIAVQESEAYSVSMKSLPVNGEENEETLICVESIFGDMDRDISLQLKKIRKKLSK